jgi:hypothetical protein
MLQLEEPVSAPDTGSLDDLIEAFPDEAASYDLSAFAKGEICIFLSVPAASTLPSRGQIAGVMRRIGERIVAGETVFSLELSPPDADVVRRLAAVLAEAVIDGSSRDFPLFAVSRQADGRMEIWASQGFCDLVLGRWDQWNSGDRDVRYGAEPGPDAEPSAPLPLAPLAAADTPPPIAEAPRSDPSGGRFHFRHLADALFFRRPAVRLGLASEALRPSH